MKIPVTNFYQCDCDDNLFRLVFKYIIIIIIIVVVVVIIIIIIVVVVVIIEQSGHPNNPIHSFVEFFKPWLEIGMFSRCHSRRR